MLEIQRQSGAKYMEYINAKIANEKAMHEKDMEIKEAKLQLLKKQLESAGTPRASKSVRRSGFRPERSPRCGKVGKMLDLD